MITPKSVPDLIRAPIPTATAGKQPIRLLLCGIPEGVNCIIYELHIRGFAEAGEWSPPLPSSLQGEGIRILVRYWRRVKGESDRLCLNCDRFTSIILKQEEFYLTITINLSHYNYKLV